MSPRENSTGIINCNKILDICICQRVATAKLIFYDTCVPSTYNIEFDYVDEVPLGRALNVAIACTICVCCLINL